MNSCKINSSGCCSKLIHSETCNKLKKPVLVIAIALSTVVVIGSILGAVALQGANISGINTVTTMVYTTLGVAVFIDIASIITLTCSCNYKQTSQTKKAPSEREKFSPKPAIPKKKRTAFHHRGTCKDSSRSFADLEKVVAKLRDTDWKIRTEIDLNIIKIYLQKHNLTINDISNYHKIFNKELDQTNFLAFRNALGEKETVLHVTEDNELFCVVSKLGKGTVVRADSAYRINPKGDYSAEMPEQMAILSARWIDNDEPLVFNKQDKNQEFKEKFIQEAEDEKKLKKVLEHTNIVIMEKPSLRISRLKTDLDDYKDDLPLSFTQPLMSKTVSFFRHPDCNYSFPQWVQIFKDFIQALEYIHRKGFTHRDIKPENLFILESENKEKGLSGKIGDLGQCTSEILDEKGGSPSWIPPEYYIVTNPNKEDYQKRDIYSLGRVFWQVIFGKKWDKKPLDGPEIVTHNYFTPRAMLEEYYSLSPADYRKRWDTLLPESEREKLGSQKKKMLELIIGIMSPKPKDRPTAKEVIRELDDL